MEDIIKIGFIGHQRENYLPHISAEKALFEAFETLEVAYQAQWISPEKICDFSEIDDMNAYWMLSDPENFSAEALALVKNIRKQDIPFLATGTAFKTLISEFIQTELGTKDDSSFFEFYDDLTDYQNVSVKIIPGTLAERCYLKNSTFNQTNCDFGLKADKINELEEAGLIISGTDENGAVKIVESPLNHFHLGTLYLPQLNSESKVPSKLVTSFIKSSILNFLTKNSIATR
jgi:CTP synthase